MKKQNKGFRLTLTTFFFTAFLVEKHTIYILNLQAMRRTIFKSMNENERMNDEVLLMN